MSLIVVDDSLLYCYDLPVVLGCYTRILPNLVIFSLILAQYTLVSLFPYLKSHWAQNVVAYLW